MVFSTRSNSTTSTASTRKPLPLKQRTSSQDTRRDYNHKTWYSLLVLLKVREFFVTVDNFSIWRRHLSWGMENGQDLRGYMTQRYGSSMVFMSLLLSTELGLLFNSAGITTTVRRHLVEGNHDTVSFWAGFMIILSALLTLLSLMSTFTAWAMVNAVDPSNAHCLFRSSIGQYAAELPGRLIGCSIYSFLISFMLFFFLLLPVGPWSILLLVCTLFLFVHVVSTFSAFGRVIMHSGAMGKGRIFAPDYEELLIPHSLHSNLLLKARANLTHNTSIIRQYRRTQQPIDRHLKDVDSMYDHLRGRSNQHSDGNSNSFADSLTYRPRADSTVRFADQELGGLLVTTDNGLPSTSDRTHLRSLTPLSDVSSSKLSVASPITPSSIPTGPDNAATTATKPPISTSASSLLPRPQGLPLPTRPPLPTPLSSIAATPTGTNVRSNDDSRIHQPLRNVSTSSLEQWLTQSSNSSIAVDSAPTSAFQNLVGESGSIRSTASRSSALSLPLPPPTLLVTTHPQTRRISSLDVNDRDLSEDERFAMDYGDFEETDHTNDDGDATAYSDEEAGERARLLDRGGGSSSSHYYSSTTPIRNDAKLDPSNIKPG